MGCFSCLRTSNLRKKSWKCWKGKSSKEDETTRKRKRRGFMCCLRGRRLKDEERLPKDEESLKNKGNFCCFNCNKSSKKAKDEEPTAKRLKCGTGCFICGRSSKDKESLRKKGSGACDKSSKVEKSSRKCRKCGMGCFRCGKSSKYEEPSGKKGRCGKSCFTCDKSSKDEELSVKKGACGMSCFACGKSSTDEELSGKNGRCGMSCFPCVKTSKDEELSQKKGRCGKCCFTCDKSSKDEESSGKKGRCGMNCFTCDKSSKDEESSGMKGRCGMNCFTCDKSSKDEESSGKKGRCGMSCFPCVKTSKDEESSQKKGRCGNSCFTCDKSSKDEESSGKKGRCGMNCFTCDKSSKDKESLRKKGRCGMNCFTCDKSTKDEDSSGKKGRRGMSCFTCEKSSKVEESSRKKGRCGMSCFTCDKSSKVEESSRKKGRCGMSCFTCDKSSKDEDSSRKKGRCGMSCFTCDKSSEDEESSEKKGRCWMSCFTCDKSSKDEESLGKIRKCGMGCFTCDKSSKDEESSRKKGNCGMGCFTCGKLSKDGESSRKCRKCGMGCFCCSGSLNKEDPSQTGGKCRICFNGNKHSSEDPSRKKEEGCMSCFCCCNPSKKEGQGQVGDKDTSSAHDREPTKRKCARGASCLCGCLHCFGSRNKNANKPRRKKMFCWKRKEKREVNHLTSLVKTISSKSGSSKKLSQAEEILRIGNINITTRVFAYNDLVEATQKFAPQCLLGKSGVGKVYKGQIRGTNRMIAVKKLDRNGYQGNREFLVEVLMLSLLSHQNLINMLGFCDDVDERILVYDYMSLGSLQDHIFDLPPNDKPLDWNTRMKIAAGAARGLEHLHDTANPTVIHGDLKASNILLDEDYNPRLADFGLANLGPVGDKNNVSTRVMGTFGYCAPEYALTGKLTKMSDIYSFGVVLLELITGQKAMDSTRPRNEQRLVDWVMPRYQDRKNFIQLADPLLEGNFPVKALYQVLAVAAMCLQEEDTTRPHIKDVLFALQFLVIPENSTVPTRLPIEPPKEMFSESTDDWQSCSDQEQEG